MDTTASLINESVRLNETIKLEVRRGGRYEAAWQRVVLEWGSKREITLLTGVSDGLVAMMRRVVKAYKRGNKTLRERLPNLHTATWSEARAAYLDLTPAEWDHQKEAAKLARALRSRMEGRLSENKLVTAYALHFYDPDLPGPLSIALRQVKAEMAGEDNGELRGDIREDALDYDATEDLFADLDLLRASQQQTEGRISAIEAELKRRDVDPDARPRGSSSDDVWAGWVAEGSADLAPDEESA